MKRYLNPHTYLYLYIYISIYIHIYKYIHFQYMSFMKALIQMSNEHTRNKSNTSMAKGV